MMNEAIKDDLYRYVGHWSFKSFLRYVIFTPGFRYVFLFRKAGFARGKLFYYFWKFLLRLHMIKYGIQIPEQTSIGTGFRIVHFGNIVIHPEARIGENFNISQGVTIGNSAGKGMGVPSIGNNVVIAPNAVVVGNISIGNDVMIAPNAFVNFDVPDGALVLGNPGKIIKKEKASSDYIVYYS